MSGTGPACAPTAAAAGALAGCPTPRTGSPTPARPSGPSGQPAATCAAAAGGWLTPAWRLITCGGLVLAGVPGLGHRLRAGLALSNSRGESPGVCWTGAGLAQCEGSPEGDVPA